MQYVFLNAPYADADGNIYFHHAASINENLPAVAAARANGGKVFVTVTEIISRDSARISIPFEQVDHIVVHPYNEQTASVRRRRYWPVFTPGARFDVKSEAAKLKMESRPRYRHPTLYPGCLSSQDHALNQPALPSA